MIAITIDDYQWHTIYGLDADAAAGTLRALGVDSVILRATSSPGSPPPRSTALDERMWITTLQQHGLRVFVAIELFQDRTLLERFPDARPVSALGEECWGEPLDGALCPTHEGVLDALSVVAADVVERLAPDGLTLRSAHYPGYWPQWTSEPDYVFSGEDHWCFCQRCRSAFAADAGVSLSGISAGSDAAGILALHLQPWRIWRARRLTLAIDRVLSASGARTRGLESMLATLPFSANDFGGIDVRRTVGGQDLGMLAGSIDAFALMTALHTLNRPVDWLNEVVRDAVRQLPGSRSVLCELQIGPHPLDRNRDHPIDVGEIAIVADAIRRAGADGMILSSWTELLSDQSAGGSKTELVREIAASWS